jgi:hypothetical protein
MFPIKRLALGTLGTLGLLGVALAGAAIAEDAREGSSTSPRQLVVLPFKDMTRLHGVGENIRSPISQRVFISGPVSDDAPDILTAHVLGRLRSQGRYIILSTAETRSTMLTLHEGSGKGYMPERELVVQTGRAMGAEVVLAAYLYRYVDRVGRDFSAESPASVAFGLHLLQTRDGRLLWSRHFDETQHALSDNLFKVKSFIQRKGKWVTAEQMARLALDDFLAELP